MAGYSGTPLVAKLGIKPGLRVALVGAPDAYRALLEPLPPGVTITKRATARTDLVHVFTTRRTELAQALASYRESLEPDAVIWVSWPKKASGVPTEVTEHTVRELALPLGLVDVKVCAVTEVWSGLKLVVRKALRGR
jgi:hypothetical protein